MFVLSLDQNLVPFGWREMLKLQRLLSNKCHRQVEVVIPELWRQRKQRKSSGSILNSETGK